ncbi:BspA family leucine-rich repeat surface protein [Aliarcobacter cryaerophilus]|uniref:BspA family leucine-rich repeat surface protein n=1 Tax=Aliarcobacter cryaerophilus TaxID=28198 RepID=UPI0021B329F7|nr:BspA family leucine-rich repeat surface protein [Aliarcobacter cryaerophilus]MCT7484174.1 BspA family leucine-rich repeat surface protein [Aliarcobacter cryaerophilus]
MGINIILPLIMGIAMTVIIGSQVAPSYIEKIKIAKVENRTISNQNLIKDAIVRYIKLEKKVPKDNDLEVLNKAGLLMDYHESNLFGGGYEFFINKKKGTLKIRTTINDDVAGKYFSNSFKFPNTPKCIEDQNGVCTGTFETFYLLDEETFKSIPIPEVGSIEDIQDRFTKVEEVGKKFDEATLVGVEKDYIVDLVTKEVTEYTYDKENNIWVENPTKIVVPSLKPSDHGVEIKNITWDFIDGLGNEVKQTHEKVVCNATSINQEVFVVNKNKGLGEIVWVAPATNNSIEEYYSGRSIRGKVLGEAYRNNFSGVPNIINFKPNNICTSNVTDFRTREEYGLFEGAQSFNQDLNRWDTSNVTNMKSMFNNAWNFNQDISSWDVSKVTNMYGLFEGAQSFNQDLNRWDTSNVTDMNSMFSNAWNFNKDISSWDVSKVTNMYAMFYQAKSFDQPIGNWNTSNVTTMGYMFYRAEKFNQDISNLDVSNVTYLYGMFWNATSFNQNLSNWCVSKIAYEPGEFDSNTHSWDKTNRQPKWGIPCP